MHGLASKWAADESLVKEAKEQDESLRNQSMLDKRHPSPSRSKPLESKWSSTITIEKTKPLESKWAVSEESTKVSKVPKSAHNGTKHTNKPDYQSLPSPPSTAEAMDRFNGIQTNPHPVKKRQPKAYARKENFQAHSKRYNKHKQHPGAGSDEDESSDEELPPMSGAAKSFAARLGLNSGSKRSSGETYSPHEDEFETTEEEITDEEPSAVESEDDEELPPMSEAGKSLAARLGMVSLDNRKHSKSMQSTQPRPPSRKKTYQTPKQRKEDVARKMKEEEESKLKKEKERKEAKLKAEVEDMFNKLSNSTKSWADLEDDY